MILKAKKLKITIPQMCPVMQIKTSTHPPQENPGLSKGSQQPKTPEMKPKSPEMKPQSQTPEIPEAAPEAGDVFGKC